MSQNLTKPPQLSAFNSQICFDGRDRIVDVVARWPGSTHDSRMLRNSGLFQLMEGRGLPGEHSYLLGDSGYPCKRWLLTPFLHIAGPAQVNYNRLSFNDFKLKLILQID